MVFRPQFCAVRTFTGRVTTFANEKNLGTNHAPGAGLITDHVDLQSSALSLCQGFTVFQALTLLSKVFLRNLQPSLIK